ncbi:ATP-dependent DNA helicase PIF1 [Ceratobasidium sp. AG-Ba]|nr:ATP-dependent DNA helicase PIF1 [Ceratobasidium sp. AG-Ba]
MSEQPPGHGPPIFKLGGQVYHRSGDLVPPEGAAPQYAQLYIYDSLEEAATLCSENPHNTGCNPALMRELTGVIHAHHQYAGIYKQIWQTTQNQNVPNLRMVIRQNRNMDPRRYNQPTGDELALIFPGEGLNSQRDIVVHHVGGGWQRIDAWNPAWACLHYVLFNPYGEHGFQRGIPLRDAEWIPGFGQQNAQGHDSDQSSIGSGNAGGHQNQRQKRTTISQLEYYLYLLFPQEKIRSGDPMPGPNDHFGTMFRGQRLFQQILVDIWANEDQSRLLWFSLNQPTIRADLFRGLVDALHTDDLERGDHVGKVLPATYYGGARQMAESYQDAMAIARYLGPPQFFVTMTANPNWPELQAELLDGQHATDRPDLAVRVFELKRRALLEDITKKHVLGRCIAHVYTIEFQKRGLPHMHLLVWVEKASHILEPEDVNDVICAEIPDQADRNLYETVTTSMLHAPCGPNFPNSTCWDPVEKKCTKGYWPLKPFSDATVLVPNAYPQYRRRNDGKSVTKTYQGQDIVLDHRHVVPYNPYLSRQYNCHINVETCSGINAIKYIFKYVYKGRDRASIDIVCVLGPRQGDAPNEPAIGPPRPPHMIDEIKVHLDARWISPYEAAWRLFKLYLHHEFPTIYRLQVHLKDQELVTFQGDQLIQDVVANRHDTKLTGFFKLNQHDNERIQLIANSMVYQEIPSKFSWDKKARKWNLRAARRGHPQFGIDSPRVQSAIGRMYFVGPNQGQKYFLRLLLTVVKAPTSFEDLRTYNNVTYDTYQECCIARGLHEDDGEWAACLEEAAVIKSGHQLRKLFVVILTFCSPNDPKRLWQNYRHHLCDDLRHKLCSQPWSMVDITDDQVYDHGLYLMQQLVEEAGSTMEAVQLDKCTQNWEQYQERNRLILEQIQLRDAVPENATENFEMKLNQQQLQAFNQIYESSVEQEGKSFFLDGPAGTGKTFLYQALCYRMRNEGHFVICVASSGIASLLLPGGRTSHSRFKIPLDLHEASVCNITINSDLAKLIRQTKLIIWDEVPMQHKFCAESFNRTCQDICNKPGQLFGGITVVFGGDFRQILPVVRRGEPEDIIDTCLKRSALWNQLTKLHLTENMRLQGDPDAAQHAAFLLEVGQGTSIEEGHSGSVRFSPDMHVPSRAALIDSVYQDLQNLQVNTPAAATFLQERTILTGRNDDVLNLNKTILAKFPGETKVYNSADKVRMEVGVDNEDTAALSTEFLNSLNCASIPVSKLELKKGCPIMILRNLAPSQGVCNGTRAVIEKMGSKVLEVKLLTGNNAGSTVFVPRITLSSEESDFGFVLERRQFPVRLAFAMTINKSQGQSVNTLKMYICFPDPYFQ